MQCLEVSGAARPIYGSLGVKRLTKIQLDAAVCSLIYFTAKSLYMFRVSTEHIVRSTKNYNRSLRYWS